MTDYSGDSTISDRNGWFKIRVDSMNSEILSISAEGFDSMEVKVDNRYHVICQLNLEKIRLPDMLIEGQVSYESMEIYNPPRRIRGDIRVRVEKSARRIKIPWQQELLDQLNYPAILVEMGVEGNQCIEFSVTTEGQVTNASIVRRFDRKYDQAVLKLIEEARAFNEEEIKLYGLKDARLHDRTYVICIKYLLTYKD